MITTGVGYVTGIAMTAGAMQLGEKIAALSVPSSSPVRRQIVGGVVAATATTLFVDRCCCSDFSNAVRVIGFFGSIAIGSFRGYQATRIQVFKTHAEWQGNPGFTVATQKWAGIGFFAGQIIGLTGAACTGRLAAGGILGAIGACAISAVGSAWEGGLVTFPSIGAEEVPES